MRFIIARAANRTGATLERLVREALRTQNITEPDVVVCYGAGYTGPKPTLNAKCSAMNKMEQSMKLQKVMGDRALRLFFPKDFHGVMLGHTAAFPWIARKIQHAKGKDMLFCINLAEAQAAIKKGREFFTPLVESDTEYRVWVWRKRILSVYEKRLTEPKKNKKFGRNRANGWTFHALNSEEIPEAIREASRAAVKALDLDFGAVDVLGKWTDKQHLEMKATVLEVNTAPGVSDEHRSGIVRLTRRIVEWINHGCPDRKAE